MPTLFYNRLGSLLRCGLYAARIEPFLKHFPRENMMFIDFAGMADADMHSPRSSSAQALPLVVGHRLTELRAEFVRSPEQVLDEVYAFIGVSRASYCPLPPGMQVLSTPGADHWVVQVACHDQLAKTQCCDHAQNEYQGRAMHPTVKAKLRDHFRESNQRLYQLLGRDFQWEDAVV